MRRISQIVLHYSATYPDQDYGVSEMRAMHLKRGFKDVGYHYVIKRDGTVQEGRPVEQVGAHVAGYNARTIGICCIGGIERATGPNVGIDNRTEAQKAATILLVHELLQKHPGAEVLGHRDLGATQCPGFDVRAWWAAIRAMPAPTKPAPQPVAHNRPVLRTGSTGAAVRELQGLLNRHGAKLTADGAFGPKTRTALIQFQSRRELRPDGVCGVLTWAALLCT